MATPYKKIYRNGIELQNGIENMMSSALQSTFDELYEELQHIIDEDVYGNSVAKSRLNTNNWYQEEIGRTYQIKNAFKKPKIYKYKQLRGRIEFDPNEITHINDWSHGHPNKQLSGNSFLKILNNEAPQGNAYNFPYVKRKPFWDDFEQYCNKNFTKIFYKYMRKLGYRPSAKK